jgi:hypothetical protein
MLMAFVGFPSQLHHWWSPLTRPIKKDLSIGQADSNRLRRPHKSVLDVRGIQVDTNDDRVM